MSQQTRTRRRATPAGPPELPTATCRCESGPITVVTFRNQQVVAVDRRHLRAERCGLPIEQVDPRQWARGR